MESRLTHLKVITVFIILLCTCTMVTASGLNPKREFRGAWMHTVFQPQYRSQTTAQNKAYICRQLDSLRLAGVNAVFFQVRPQADTFYESKIEPWSIFLTDDGRAPKPLWDPLAFIIRQAHERGMELHAWLNPYRVTSGKGQTIAKSHIYHRHPERFVTYDNKIYFDPGIPENRRYIASVVTDIVRRYDVDGIHLDDYFYPYPAKGKEFPDTRSYRKYGHGMARDDWRRDNVNRLIEELSSAIKSIKPWVRFGISPFGIWRNKTSDPRGSDTNGLENYDGLYADVILWSEKGWVDYLMPQLYWTLENPRASYATLVKWWNDNASNRHVYIGQHVERTMANADLAPSGHKSQLKTKMDMTRDAANIQGVCWWPGYAVTRNYKGIADSLSTSHHSSIALPPPYPWLSSVCNTAAPTLSANGHVLSWSSQEPTGVTSDHVRFVLYRFDDKDCADFDDASNILLVTPDSSYKVTQAGYYAVSALDRANNESNPSTIIYIGQP